MVKIKSFISLEEAIEIIDINTKNLEVESVDLINGIGRISVENIYSPIDNPPFNKSAMDGYAIIAEQTSGEPIKLKVIDEVFAGGVCKNKVTYNTAIKIMTGAPIPNGANAVIRQEDVELQSEYIKVSKFIKDNENVCFRGEDIKEGTLLVNKDKKLNYADIGILASAGISEINVYKKPKVAFISTGDEVVDVNVKLEAGKIYNSNKYSILGRLTELGYDVSYIDHENDSYLEIGNKIINATEVADLIITTGGASVGEKDLIKEAIDSVDGEMLFWKIKIKPGSAVLCSKINNKMVLSLSGNPTAALTTFELLVRTTLEKLGGKDKIELIREKAKLKDDILKKSIQRRFVRGKVLSDANGQEVIVTQFKSGNGILSSTLNSNCLIEIEAGNEGINKGTLVDIIKF